MLFCNHHDLALKINGKPKMPRCRGRQLSLPEIQLDSEPICLKLSDEKLESVLLGLLCQKLDIIQVIVNQRSQLVREQRRVVMN